MKKIKLIKEAIKITDTPLEAVDSLELFGTEEELRDIISYKLIEYYKIAVNNSFSKATILLEKELNRRRLTRHIIPMETLLNPKPEDFTFEIMHTIVDSKGSLAPVIKLCDRSTNPSATLVCAYVIALLLDVPYVAKSIGSHIKMLNTYDNYMKNFLLACKEKPEIVKKLSELTKAAEGYAAWG